MLAKRTWVAFLLLLGCPGLVSAQLRFIQPAANLGELRGGPIYQHRFEFVNESAAPLEISDLRLGCGCLRPVLDKRLYQAGEKGSLLMHLRTLGQLNGPRTWQTHVQYRQEGKLLESSLTLAAIIRNEVTIEPSVVALTVETTLKQEITIRDTRTTPLKITTVRASSPAIRVSTQALGDGITKLILEVSRSALTATRQEETLNLYSDDPDYRHLQVPITLIKATRVEVSATPEKIEIIGSGSQLVRLRAAGDKAVRIAKAGVDHSAIQCTWAEGPGNDATLKISLNAERLATASTLASVTIQLTEPSVTAMTLTVSLRKE